MTHYTAATTTTTYRHNRYQPRSGLFQASTIKTGGFELGPYADPFQDFDTAYSVGDWDGCGAIGLSPEVLACAKSYYSHIGHYLRRSLPKPLIAPGPEGTIGFQWHFKAGDYEKIFVEILPNEMICSYYILRQHQRLEKHPPTKMQPDGFRQLDDVLKSIAGDE